MNNKSSKRILKIRKDGIKQHYHKKIQNDNPYFNNLKKVHKIKSKLRDYKLAKLAKDRGLLLTKYRTKYGLYNPRTGQLLSTNKVKINKFLNKPIKKNFGSKPYMTEKKIDYIKYKPTLFQQNQDINDAYRFFRVNPINSHIEYTTQKNVKKDLS